MPRHCLEDGWFDIDEFARAVLADMPALRHISMSDITTMAATDSKDRFEFRKVSPPPDPEM